MGAVRPAADLLHEARTRERSGCIPEAIEAPRWYHGSGRTLQLESRFPEHVRKGLAAKGHEVQVLGEWAEITGGAQAVAIDENGVFSGGADPRREGYAAGY